MTIPQVGTTTFHTTVPFLTINMFKAEPTGLAPDQLVSGQGISPAQQDQELARIILKAAAEMNSFCYGASGGVLHATLDTQSLNLPVNRRGEFRIHPRFTPVRALHAFSWGVDQAALVPLNDLSHIQVDPGVIVVPGFPFTGWSSAGPLQFGIPAGPGYDVRCQFTYANGWPCTTLAASTSAGATAFTVADATGVYVGDRLTIHDTATGDETVTVITVSGSVIGCTPALAHAHGVTTDLPGIIQVDGLPGDVIQANAEMTMGMLKRRSQETLIEVGHGHTIDLGSPGQDNFARAVELLGPYVQVRSR